MTVSYGSVRIWEGINIVVLLEATYHQETRVEEAGCGLKHLDSAERKKTEPRMHEQN